MKKKHSAKTEAAPASEPLPDEKIPVELRVCIIAIMASNLYDSGSTRFDASIEQAEDLFEAVRQRFGV